MPTDFPTSVDTFTNPTSGNALTSPSHADQHTNANDAIEAIETEVLARGSFIDYAEHRRTSGSITINSTTWIDLSSATDLVVDAAVGDIIEISAWGVYGTENISVNLNAATLVSAARVNYFGSGEPTTSTGAGIWGWSKPASSILKPFGGSASIVVQAGDISAGTVTIRLRTKSSGSITLFATTADQFFWSAKVFRGP